MKWREKWQVDEIDTWETPAVLKSSCPHGTTGFDKDNSPIIFIPFAGIDIWGLLHSSSKRDIIKNTIKILESESIDNQTNYLKINRNYFDKGYMKIAYTQSQEHGAEARKFTVIFDMDNFSMKQYAYRPAAELVINTFQMYSNNYPEILKYCYVINGKLTLISFIFNQQFCFQRQRSFHLPSIL